MLAEPTRSGTSWWTATRCVTRASTSSTAESAPGAEVLELRRGHDFDKVVLALPPDVQKTVCASLRDRSPRYAEMLANSPGAP